MRAGLEDDNIGEEIVEGVIQSKTGLDVDLTPLSPEYRTKTLSPMPPQPNANKPSPFILGE